jgi:membrane protein DedA with SNARE-associated domain
MIDFIDTWGYFAIFGFLFLENAALVGFFVPGITVLVLGGFLAGTGQLNPALVVAASWLGVVTGDVVCYLAGRFFLTRSRRIRKLVSELDPSGLRSWTILFFQFPVPSRIAVPLLAGSIRMSPLAALGADFLATTVFVISVGGVGFAAGLGAGTVAQAEQWSEWLQYLFISLFLFWVTWLLVIWRRRISRLRRNVDGG